MVRPPEGPSRVRLELFHVGLGLGDRRMGPLALSPEFQHHGLDSFDLQVVGIEGRSRSLSHLPNVDISASIVMIVDLENPSCCSMLFLAVTDSCYGTLTEARLLFRRQKFFPEVPRAFVPKASLSGPSGPTMVLAPQRRRSLSDVVRLRPNWL